MSPERRRVTAVATPPRPRPQGSPRARTTGARRTERLLQVAGQAAVAAMPAASVCSGLRRARARPPCGRPEDRSWSPADQAEPTPTAVSAPAERGCQRSSFPPADVARERGSATPLPPPSSHCGPVLPGGPGGAGRLPAGATGIMPGESSPDELERARLEPSARRSPSASDQPSHGLPVLGAQTPQGVRATRRPAQRLPAVR